MNSLNILSTENDEFKKNYPNILKKVGMKKLTEIEPTIDEMTKVYDIIINFIKTNKRKVYGGYALNKLLIMKKQSYAIYDEYDSPDIEFYSPDPMSDLIKLCDIISEKGYKNIMGQEAQHKETYKIYVNFHSYCDITYMPLNIYNKCRYIQSEGFNLIHPWFMTIDFFRMFTDPIVSYWRLEKHFSRYLKLQKIYPLPLINKPLTIKSSQPDILTKVIHLFEEFLSSKTSIIFTGFYIYNYYLTNSEYFKANSKFKEIKIPYLEVYSIEYIQDGLDILKFVDELPVDIKKNILHVEFNPFFCFYGYNTVFYYKIDDVNIPILYFYSNNQKCIPYKEVPYLSFNNIKKKSSSLINIGSFDFNILHALIILVKVRIDDDNDWNDIIYTFINNIVSFRNFYFNKHKKTLYDNTIYEGFVVNCKGVTIMPDREKRLLMQIRKKLGKSPIYRYEPGVSKHPSQYFFANSSGNKISNPINSQLTVKNLNKKLEDELENNELMKIIPKKNKKINKDNNSKEDSENESDKISITDETSDKISITDETSDNSSKKKIVKNNQKLKRNIDINDIDDIDDNDDIFY
jgi:hypothetical protein